MKQIEFDTHMAADQTLRIRPELAPQVPLHRALHAVVTADELTDEPTCSAWGKQPASSMRSLLQAHGDLDQPLVTRNTRHYQDIPGLKLDDWIE